MTAAGLIETHYKVRFDLLIHKYYNKSNFQYIFGALYFVCIVWFCIINDHLFIASDKWMKNYVHCLICALPVFIITIKDNMTNRETAIA